MGLSRRPTVRVMRIGACALVMALAVILGWRLLNQPPAAKIGQPVPTFGLPLLQGGGRLTLSDLQGKAVLLNFWASDCAPCIREMPALKALVRANGGQIAVIGVVEQDRRSDAAHYALSHSLNFPSVFDANFDVAARFSVAGTPETVVLDRQHRLVTTLRGPITLAQNRDRLNAALRAMTT